MPNGRLSYIELGRRSPAERRRPRLTEHLQQLCSRAEPILDREGLELLRGLRRATLEADSLISSQEARIRFLESLSITDELTGLLNRRGFQQELLRARARSLRHGETGLLLLCDLDHFKSVNDTLGHPIGDRVLRAVAGMLRSHTRHSDYVARLGGDEFAVLMTDTARALGEELAAKLERFVNGHILVHQGHEVPISASFGYEVYGLGGSLEATFCSADQALYRNKATASA